MVSLSKSKTKSLTKPPEEVCHAHPGLTFRRSHLLDASRESVCVSSSRPLSFPVFFNVSFPSLLTKAQISSSFVYQVQFSSMLTCLVERAENEAINC